MQLLVLFFIAICHIDIRPLFQHIVAALNCDPRSPMPVSLPSMPSCLSFIALSSVLLLKILTSYFQDEVCEMLFSVCQQQINDILLTVVPQPCSKSQFQPISTLFPLFSNEILKTSLKSTFPPAYTKAVNYTVRQDIRLVWRQLLQRFTLTDLYNLIIPWGRGRPMDHLSLSQFYFQISKLQLPSFVPFLKPGIVFTFTLSQGHHPPLRSPWRWWLTAQSVAAGTPSAPGEMPSASVDLNIPTIYIPLKMPFLDLHCADVCL